MSGVIYQTIPKSSGKGQHDISATPKYFYAQLDAEFHFDFDPCPLNPTFDGLSIEWGARNYSNPPYSKKRLWIEKAIQEQKKGKLTVMLLPVDTSTGWFHDLLVPNAEIRFVRGRLKLDGGKHPLYASMLAIFRPIPPNPESFEPSAWETKRSNTHEGGQETLSSDTSSP